MIKEFIQLIKWLFNSKPNDFKELEVVQMKYFPFNGFLAMSWCGRLITKYPNRLNQTIITHETIHLKQAQQYNFWISYYVVYLFEWLKGNPFIKPYISAYYTNPFEVEAYANEDNPNYIMNYNPKLIKEKYNIKERKIVYTLCDSFNKWRNYLHSLN